MASLTFIFNGQSYTTLIAPVGMLTAFSGNGPHRNNPDSAGVADGGPIPGGIYYIVDRQSGGMMGSVRDWALDRDKWFALYRDDGTIDDFTFVSGVSRGLFRLHPLGARRMSTGCVVLQHQNEFDKLREHLLKEPMETIPGLGIRSYGVLSVGALAQDGSISPGRRRRGRPSRRAVV